MPELDILYMTRVQRERFFNEEDYLRLKDSYILEPSKLQNAKSDLCIMHPLPRVNEISIAVDSDPRACYFKQVLNGKYMRMALILKLLEEAKKEESEKEDLTIKSDVRCKNKKCITQTERGLENEYEAVDSEKGIYKCIFCEEKAMI